MQEPILMTGSRLVNERGAISFVNDFTFKDVRRFYMLTSAQVGLPREWHGHKTEFKYAMVIAGAAIVAAVPIDNWQAPSKDVRVFSYEISAEKPMVVYIPPGYANSFMAMRAETSVMFFSNLTVEQSQADDFRYPADYWDPKNNLKRTS